MKKGGKSAKNDSESRSGRNRTKNIREECMFSIDGRDRSVNIIGRWIQTDTKEKEFGQSEYKIVCKKADVIKKWE